MTDVAPSPDCEPHTPCPSGYLARAQWFEDMAEAGYIQRQCRGCGLWAIWEKPPSRTARDQSGDACRGRVVSPATRTSDTPDQQGTLEP